MSLIRMWLFTPREGYAEGGTYDTSVMDSDTGNCSNPAQFEWFEEMLNYSIDHGEELQQVENAEEAYAMCSRQRLSHSSAPCGGGPTNNQSTISAAISRPVNACAYTGGGSKSNVAAAVCPPVPPMIEPAISNQPMVSTQSDNAQRIIALYRRNKVIPTIVY